MEDSVAEGEGAVYFVFVWFDWGDLRKLGPLTREGVVDTKKEHQYNVEAVIRGVDVSEEFGV